MRHKQDQETWQGSWVGQWTLKSSRKTAEVEVVEEMCIGHHQHVQWMKGRGREAAGGSSSERCAPKGIGQWDPDPGQPARGGAQPLESVHAHPDKYKPIKSTLCIAKGLMSFTRHSVNICWRNEWREGIILIKNFLILLACYKHAFHWHRPKCSSL